VLLEEFSRDFVTFFQRLFELTDLFFLGSFLAAALSDIWQSSGSQTDKALN